LYFFNFLFFDFSGSSTGGGALIASVAAGTSTAIESALGDWSEEPLWVPTEDACDSLDFKDGVTGRLPFMEGDGVSILGLEVVDTESEAEVE